MLPQPTPNTPSASWQTASLLEAVASAALRARLRESRSVTAAISADTWSLLQGRVNGVRVTGEGWASPLNLTARRLDATVGAAVIDPLALLLRQNIELVNVPVGTCRVLFDPSDFGHFLVHPLLVAAAARAVQGHAFAFDGSAVRISAPSPAAPGGVVECSGTWRGDGGRFIVRLLPRTGMGQGVQVHAIPTSSGGRASECHIVVGDGKRGSHRPLWRRACASGCPLSPAFTAPAWPPHACFLGLLPPPPAPGSASIVEDGLTAFFNSLTLDLQGVTLSFLSLEIIPGAGFAGGMADLNLRLELRKFPPLHLQF